MALINWTNDFSVKVKEIDEQHKVLIGFLNDLHDAMKVGKGKKVIDEIIDGLVEYTVFHFGHEENLMKKTGYSECSLHLQEHKKLIESVTKYKSDLKNGNMTSSIEIMNFLKDWLTNHILKTDKKYSAHLNSKGIQ